MRYDFDHLHLRSRDAVAAARFYGEVLGAREIGREGGEAPSRIILDLGGLRMFIEQAPEGTGPAAVPPHRGIEHIGLRVEDIEATVADLAGRGIPLVSGITDIKPGLRIAFFEGPDGVRIEVLQRG
ncbi:VOC family protein [Methylobacterium nonmethylotrophicum]|uniref:VOC family protein n=1 Tax=Methylobacterium nonmethylotrophicum TaxID=1141884 RepID=A0A4Z0NKA6_9HYPH|nr:VOC family protein [Methylobacterium nonmethylotrophicum]TGD96803.1 VOC family protein [Methylobacterium nonmethylotrophicum]